MNVMLMLAATLKRLLTGPPLTGPRLVVPIPPFVAGPGVHVEVGLCGRWIALRLVRTAGLWTPSTARDLRDDPDADLGRHDAWASF